MCTCSPEIIVLKLSTATAIMTMHFSNLHWCCGFQCFLICISHEVLWNVDVLQMFRLGCFLLALKYSESVVPTMFQSSGFIFLFFTKNTKYDVFEAYIYVQDCWTSFFNVKVANVPQIFRGGHVSSILEISSLTVFLLRHSPIYFTDTPSWPLVIYFKRYLISTTRENHSFTIKRPANILVLFGL